MTTTAKIILVPTDFSVAAEAALDQALPLASKQISRMIDAFSNQVGRINLNAQSQRGPDSFPFNGRKDSAEGTLSIADALRVFSIRTIVATKNTDENIQIISNIIRNRESAFLSTDYIF